MLILFRCILASVGPSVGRLSIFFESRKRKVGKVVKHTGPPFHFESRKRKVVKHAGGRIVVPQVLVLFYLRLRSEMNFIFLIIFSFAFLKTSFFVIFGNFQPPSAPDLPIFHFIFFYGK